MSDTTVGIIIGGGFTALGVLVQGLISWFLDCRRHLRRLAEQKEEKRMERLMEIQRQRERTYRDFLDIYGTILSWQAAVQIDGRLNMLTSSLSDLIPQIARILSPLQLYGSPKVIEASTAFMRQFVVHLSSKECNEAAVQNIENELMKIKNLMRLEVHGAMLA